MDPPPLFHVAACALPAGEAVRPYTIGREYSALLQLAEQALGAGPDAVGSLLTGEAWGYVRRHGGTGGRGMPASANARARTR